jgi:hypothetical protein
MYAWLVARPTQQLRSSEMERRSALAAARLIFAILTVAAIVTQLADLAGNGTLNPVSYFTIDSNLIAAIPQTAD